MSKGFLGQIKHRLQFVRARDVLAVFPMTAGFIASLPFRIFHRNIWLICERKGEARDNGYWFFRYMCLEHPETEAVYAIDRKSPDFEKVNALGRVIQFGSLKHWIYYFAAKKNISSQKEGKPNFALCFFLEVCLGLRKNRVFLQHGITQSNLRWLYRDMTKMNLFCLCSPREYQYVKDNYGYRENELVLTGFCRYDNLGAEHEVKRQIVVIPTMRRWLSAPNPDTLKYEKSMEFTDSEYYLTWQHLINNSELNELLVRYDTELLFYLHPAMQQFVDRFSTSLSNVRIGTLETELQTVLMESSVLVTDFSSVYFDFAYMKKPVVYYQFDVEKYQQGHYQQGYFSCETDGFGPVVNSEDRLVSELSGILERGCVTEDIYLKRSENFFAFRDTDNCKRTYEAIVRMQNPFASNEVNQI